MATNVAIIDRMLRCGHGLHVTHLLAISHPKTSVDGRGHWRDPRHRVVYNCINITEDGLGGLDFAFKDC